MARMSRRHFMGATAALTAGLPAVGRAEDGPVIIAWPNDVTSWDPNQRFVPDAQSIYKAVFDQPIMQAPDLKLIPWLITKWDMAPDALSLTVDLRDDVVFHNGDKMTAEDFRFTFFDRTRPGQGLDIANSWSKVHDIEVQSPTRAVMHFSSPAPTAPQWLAFMGSFVVPKAYLTSVGAAQFAQKPVGSGPYRVADYEMNARIVLERHEQYWGPKPKLARIIIQVVRDPSARVAAIMSGQADLTTNVAVREIARLKNEPTLVAETDPVTRIIMLQVRNDQGFADPRVRLAAHHAIDKVALSKAFFGGAARPLSIFATPGAPGDVPGFTFAYDPEKSKALLAEAGFGPDKPAKIGLGATNGHFPGDYDIARALVQMWQRVGIVADLQVIEYAQYFEMNRGGKLPEATVYSWENATADPEIYIGYMLNPKMSFSPSKDPALGARVVELFGTADYDKRVAGYRALEQDAVAAGLSMPLLQGVVTVVRKKDLDFTHYDNGWILPQTITRT